MNFDNLSAAFFVVVFLFVAGSMVSKVIKHGGFKGAMFGAPIKRTTGEVAGTGSKLMSVAVKVHILGGDSADKAVGLEFVAKSVASYQMIPITLSASEAKKLATYLQVAASA